MLLPTNVSTGRVTGQFIVGVTDGDDADQDPDVIPAAGFVTFTASVPYLPDPTASPNPVTILQTSIVAVLDPEGYLCTPLTGSLDPGYRGVRLFATDDPDVSVVGWTWTATYKFATVAGAPLAIPTHSFAVPSDGTVDLTTVIKVPSSTGIGTEQAEALAASAQAAAVAAAASAAAAAGSAAVTDSNIADLVTTPDTDTATAVQAIAEAAAAEKLDADDAATTYQTLGGLDANAAAKVGTGGTSLNTAVKAIADASSGSKIPTSQKGAAFGVATLDVNSKVPVAQIPDLSATYAAKSVETSKLDASQKGSASGVAPLDAGSKVPDANLPQRLQDTDLTTKIDGRITPVVNSAVPPAVSSYIASDPSVVNSAATMAASNAGLLPKWKANTAYALGQQVVEPGGDVVSATVAFTSSGAYNSANWTPSTTGTSLIGRTIPDNTDFHTLSQAGWHKSLQFAPSNVNAPWVGVRTWVHVMPTSTSNRTLMAVSYEASPRIALKAYVSGAWGSWVYLDPAAIATLTGRVTTLEGKAPTPPKPASGLKVVPLQLNLGNATQTDGALTGTFRYPMKWNAPLQRVRVNIQNVHPSSGTVKTGAVDFTGLWVGKHASNGAFTAAPTQVQGAFSTPADGSKWVSKWFWLNQTPGVEDLLSFGYTASNGTVFNINGAGWKSTDPAVAGQQSPTLTSEGMLPFYVWLEAETYATTPHIGVMGDSIASGVGAAHVQNSWLSKYCYTKGALPTHYSNSGDTLESWGTNLNHFKWNVFDGLAIPDAVIIAGGSNDLNGVRTNVEIQSYYNAVAAQFKAKGVPNLYAANILPRTSGESATFEVNRRAHNNWLTGLPGGVRDLFNFRDVVSSDDETLNPAYDYDGVHLNSAGYAAIAASITRPVTTPPVMYQTV